MTMPQALTPIICIAKYTLTDELRQKSFIMMCVICALAILLVRGCFSGNIMLGGQALDAEGVIRLVSKTMFHVIAAGAMLLAALLSMRVFKRDRDQGMQSCILSKPVTRSQYVAGKVLGLSVLSMLFMFILHGIVFIIASIYLQMIMAEYLIASLICSLNLLFVVVTVLLFSLLMPDIIAFLCVMGIGIISFVADGIFAMSQNQMGQAMMQQSVAPSDLSGWKVAYYLWPKLSGIQQVASSFISQGAFQGLMSIYPFINILISIFVFGALLFWRFRKEDLV
jgi:ABC-type transport system involved in multi-copper enzyme maturation permease subunit